MNSPAHIKAFVGAAGADLKTDEHVHVATDFMGHFLYLVAVDGDSMLATSAFLILHDHSASTAAIAAMLTSPSSPWLPTTLLLLLLGSFMTIGGVLRHHGVA